MSILVVGRLKCGSYNRAIGFNFLHYENSTLAVGCGKLEDTKIQIAIVDERPFSSGCYGLEPKKILLSLDLFSRHSWQAFLWTVFHDTSSSVETFQDGKHQTPVCRQGVLLNFNSLFFDWKL